MAYPPCENPNCKSYGKPHPNCKCYGEMAEGGEVEPYCSGGKPHEEGCEYHHVMGLSGIDHAHAIAGHLANGGLIGMLRMDKDHDIDKYEKSVKKGHKTLDMEFGKILNGEKLSPSEDRSKHHKYIDDWISKGGVTHNLVEEIHNQSDPHEFAHGGEVAKEGHGVHHNHPIEHAYPDQNIGLQAARGRASNYLGALRPQENMPKLAFDADDDQTSKKKTYSQALKIADHPMSLLHDVSKGTVDPEQISHLKAMYPELHDSMQKKVTEKIIDAQLNGKRPDRKIRQGLSLLMGTPLSWELTPQGIVAAQSVFANKPPPQESAPQQQGKGSKAALSKSDNSFLTGNQALVRRDQNKS